MAGISEESYLLDCWQNNVCPYCKKTFPTIQRVGSGRKKDGGFCSLNCYTEYHKLNLADRHQRRTQEARNSND